MNDTNQVFPGINSKSSGSQSEGILTLILTSNSVSKQGVYRYVISPGEVVVIGRESGCQILLDSNKYAGVSRRHLEIKPIAVSSQLAWEICDLNSVNGTYVNGKRIEGTQILQSGDRILVGQNGPEFLFEQVPIPDTTPTPTAEKTSNPPVVKEVPIPISTPVPSPVSEKITPASIPVLNQGTGKCLWELNTEDNVRVLLPQTDGIHSIAFSANGETLAVGYTDKTIKLHSLATGEVIATFSGHRMPVNAIAFSLDNHFLATGSQDKTIKIWNIDTGTEIATLSGHKMSVNAVAFSPDRQSLASGSTDKTVKLWQLDTQEEIRTISEHKLSVNAVAFSPNGKLLASGSSDKTIKLWSCDPGEATQIISGLKSTVNFLIFSPDGKILASSSEDKTIKLWNLQTTTEIRTIAGYLWQVGAVAISRDGKLFASITENQTIKVWYLF